MATELKVIGIQTNLIWEDPSQNMILIEQKIKSLSMPVDLIVLPEMFTTGFTINPMKVAETMEGETLGWMKRIAKEQDTAIAGSLVISEAQTYFNRFVFVYPSGEIAYYNKRHLFTLASEHQHYTAGTTNVIIEYKGWRICPFVCYDLRFPVWSRNVAAYDVVLYVANWPEKRIQAWDTLLKARAIENMAYVVGVNRIGIDDNNYSYPGHSTIIDYLGNSLHSLPTDADGVVYAVLAKEPQEKTRQQLGFLNDKDLFSIQ